MLIIAFVSTATAENGSKPSDVLPGLIATVGRAVEAGQSFPELPIPILRALGQFGMFGTATENSTSAAEPWSAYRARARLERPLGLLATNFDFAMSEAAQYKAAREDGVLGLTVALAQTHAVTLRRHGVFVGEPRYAAGASEDSLPVDGVVGAISTTYIFPDPDSATMFHVSVQGGHHKTPVRHIVEPHSATPDWVSPANPWDPAWVPPPRTYESYDKDVFLERKSSSPVPQPDRVEVNRPDEHERIINEAISENIRNELEAIGIVLPRWKVSLDEWLEVITIHPEIEAWLRAIDDTYIKMHEVGFVAADYVDDPEREIQPSRRSHIPATDPSPSAKAGRDAFNGLIHRLKNRGGDSRYNLEQHPNRRKRFTIERGVYLRRPRPPKESEPYTGIPNAQPVSLIERAWMEIKETWTDVRENPKKRIAEMLPDFLGGVLGKATGGLVDVGVSLGVLLVKGVVSSWKGVSNYIKDVTGYQKQKRKARANLASIHTRLQQMYAEITAQSRPNEFPKTPLQDSKQLDLIKRMTAIMRSRLDYQA